MATWREVQERVRDEYVLDVDRDSEFALNVEHRGEDGPRLQRLLVRQYRDLGQEMIEVRSAFGEYGDYDLTSLLTESLEFPIGGIALHGRFLVLVQKECLAHITVDGVLFLITHISLLADLLEERKGQDRF